MDQGTENSPNRSASDPDRMNENLKGPLPKP